MPVLDNLWPFECFSINEINVFSRKLNYTSIPKLLYFCKNDNRQLLFPVNHVKRFSYASSNLYLRYEVLVFITITLNCTCSLIIVNPCFYCNKLEVFYCILYVNRSVLLYFYCIIQRLLYKGKTKEVNEEFLKWIFVMLQKMSFGHIIVT